jgi:putative Holliday junction resolvase
MRWLAIDFGERRIGLALCDRDEAVAVPLTVLERTTDRIAAAAIAELCDEHGIEAIALGEPRSRSGDAERRVHAFGDRLARRTARPVHYVDETLTTSEAEERLRSAGVAPGDRAERVDAIAAAVLLEELLERRKRGEVWP